MPLTPLTPADYEKTASALIAYWKKRGMTYDRAWAISYLREGHRKDVLSDTFYLYYEYEQLVGLAALVVYQGGVGEILDEILFPWHTDGSFFIRMIGDLMKLAKHQKLRKIYSLSLGVHVADYHRLGFEKEGVLKSHFKEGEDLTVMSKFL